MRVEKEKIFIIPASILSMQVATPVDDVRTSKHSTISLEQVKNKDASCPEVKSKSNKGRRRSSGTTIVLADRRRYCTATHLDIYDSNVHLLFPFIDIICP